MCCTTLSCFFVVVERTFFISHPPCVEDLFCDEEKEEGTLSVDAVFVVVVKNVEMVR